MPDGSETSNELRRAIAAHEGGHAVVAWVLNVHVERLWVDGGGGTQTNVEDERQLPLIDQVAIARARACATHILNAPAPSYLATRDREHVFVLLSGRSSEEINDHLEGWRSTRT
jgi:hypothetical protein